jgi:hypothetical protein
MDEKQKPVLPHGSDGIRSGGHRDYVGGMWEEIGRLQFDFMLAQGLRPEDVLLDIGCGSLRAGVLLVPYLNKGNYLGIEKEQLLLECGVAEELGATLCREKEPELVVSADFEFSKFSKCPNFAIAQSLFTHLVPEMVESCLEKLGEFVKPSCRFFATFFEAQQNKENPSASHDHLNFHYTRQQMEAFGEKFNWSPRYIGNWRHPRGQKMMEYVYSP